VLLLDTHVLVWLDEGSPRLGRKAIEKIDASYRAGQVAVSAISFWEIGTLVRKGRIQLEMDLLKWRDDLLGQGLIELPVTGEIGINAAGLTGFHGDPADRILVATALQQAARLVTADRVILSSKLAIGCLHARR
jgi:PIN domain nuclease of toxin-antitoxin system